MRSKAAMETVSQALASSLPKRAAKSTESWTCPSRFVDFVRAVGVTLHPGQSAFCRVAYDGDGIASLTPEEQGAARAIFGELGDVPARARGVVAAVCGGRAGKTYVLVALRLVHGMLVRDLSSLAPGQRAVALVVAPNDKLRQEAVNYALGLIRKIPPLRAMLVLPKGARDDDTPSDFGMRRPDGHIVTFESGVATRGGYGGRGRSFTDVAMDEVAFFRDASYKVNDADIFKAASSRVIPGGQTIVASTPWAEAGLLYDLWAANHGNPTTALVGHAPTAIMNPSPFALEMIARERERDPDNAEREFDAKFMAGGTTVFFEAGALASAVDASLELPRTPQPGEEVAAGADFGFRSDSSALVITHRQGRTVVTGEVLELRPEEGVPLKPSRTVKQFAERMKANGCTYLMADGHYRETIVEHLGDEQLAYAEAPTAPAEAYVRARMLLREGRLKLPNHPRLLQQLREVQGRPLPGGGMSIIHPRWRTGGHGDIASAWVLAVYQLAGEEIRAATPASGSAQWEEQEREKRRQRNKAAAEQSWWSHNVDSGGVPWK